MNSKERDVYQYEIVLSLLTFQCFSVGGLMGQVYWDGVRCGELANEKKENGPVKSPDAPCSSQSMMHAFLRGENVLETLHLNLPTYDDARLIYGGNIGHPIWEQVPSSLSDSERIKNATLSYVGRLVPMARVVLLHESMKTILLGNGFKYPVFTDGFPQEPSATLIVRTIRKKETRTLLSFQSSKSIWRELGAIIIKRNADGVGGPLALRNIPDSESCDLIVSALKRDKATIVDTIESQFHIPSRLRKPDGTEAYEEEVRIAEQSAYRLCSAIEEYRTEIDGCWEQQLTRAGASKGVIKAKLYTKGMLHFWTTVEKYLPLLMTHIDAIDTENALPTREKWRKMLFATACESYRITCGQETPRQIRAFAKGWMRLNNKKEKVSAIPTIEEEGV